MSLLPANSRKIAVYGKKRSRIVAVHQDATIPPSENAEATGSAQIYASGDHRGTLPRNRVSGSPVVPQFRVCSPARRGRIDHVARSPVQRPPLVARPSSNNELQQLLVPSPQKPGRTPPRLLPPASDRELAACRAVGGAESRNDATRATGSSDPPRSSPDATTSTINFDDLSLGSGTEAQVELTSSDKRPSSGGRRGTSQRTLRSRRASFSVVVGGEPVASNSKSLLDACNHSRPIPFDDIMKDIGYRLSLPGWENTKARWTKIAEASYSEVFAVTTAAQKAPAADDITVVKIIPLRGDPVRRNGKSVELPQETHCADAERELHITRMLAGDGFVALKGAFVITGAYPSKLLATWDAFSAGRCSENIRPDAFPASQQYLLLCLPHCGVELETFKLSSWTEALSILWQIALHIARAERSHKFEHRDLHWGNILVQRVPPTQAAMALAKSAGSNAAQALAALSSTSPAEWPVRLHPARSGVRATIIDYTLSRATTSSCDDVLFSSFDDHEIFDGDGDEQFDVYRQMRDLVDDDWSASVPTTNLLVCLPLHDTKDILTSPQWLRYLSSKLLNEKGLKRPPTSTKRCPSVTPLRGPASSREMARQRAALCISTAEFDAYTALQASHQILEVQMRSATRDGGGNVWQAGATSFVTWFTSTMQR